MARTTSRWYYCGGSRGYKPLHDRALTPRLTTLSLRLLRARQGILPLRVLHWAALTLLICLCRLDAAGLEVKVSAPSRESISAVAVDGAGRPVARAVVAFQLPAEGPGGRFANGLATEIVVAGPDGKAEVKGIHWDLGVSSVPVRVNASFQGERAATVFEWRSPSAPPVPVVSKAEPAQPGTVAPAARPTVRAADPDLEVPVYRGGSGWGKRLLVIAAVAGGAAAGGMWARQRGIGGSSSGTGGPAAAVVTTPSITIGAPIITVGRP